MNKRELIFAVLEASSGLENEANELNKRLNGEGGFDGPAKEVNEKRFIKFCREALKYGEYPQAVKMELVAIKNSGNWGGARKGSGREAAESLSPSRRIPRSVNFSGLEWEAVKEKAAESGMNISEYIRAKSLG